VTNIGEIHIVRIHLACVQDVISEIAVIL